MKGELFIITKENERNYYTTHRHDTYVKISNCDFCGYTTMAEIANNIITDMKFDKMCAKNAKLRDDYISKKKNNNTNKKEL